jgi:hypothetical protein
VRRAVSWALVAVFFVGLAMFFSVEGAAQGEGDRNSSRFTSRLTIGAPWPWYERVTERVVSDGNERVTETAGVHPTSPAWLILLVVAGAGYGLYRLQPRASGGGSRAPGPSAAS